MSSRHEVAMLPAASLSSPNRLGHPQAPRSKAQPERSPAAAGKQTLSHNTPQSRRHAHWPPAKATSTGKDQAVPCGRSGRASTSRARLRPLQKALLRTASSRSSPRTLLQPIGHPLARRSRSPPTPTGASDHSASCTPGKRRRRKPDSFGGVYVKWTGPGLDRRHLYSQSD
jgi:hypothetical protein